MPSSSEIANEDNSGFLEIATISWATGIFVKGFKKTLTSEDLGELSRSMTAEVSKNQLIRYYAEVSTKNNGKDFSPSWAFWRIVRTRMLLSVFFLLLYVSVEFTKAVSKSWTYEWEFVPPTFHKFVHKVPLFSLHSCLFCFLGCYFVMHLHCTMRTFSNFGVSHWS